MLQIDSYDTSIGEGNSAFAATQWGEILRARDGNPQVVKGLRNWQRRTGGLSTSSSASHEKIE